MIDWDMVHSTQIYKYKKIKIKLHLEYLDEIIVLVKQRKYKLLGKYSNIPFIWALSLLLQNAPSFFFSRLITNYSQLIQIALLSDHFKKVFFERTALSGECSQ